MAEWIRIGTSGWNYPHWQGIFYPSDCPRSRWLEWYAKHFDTVELNATFYRLPKPKTFENWKLRTPDNFLWALKASRYITHIKRLKEPEEPLERFYKASAPLQDKLGPILFQLPPGLPFDEDRFEHFCRTLRPSHRYALEVRHPSWIDNRLFAILRRYSIAFCIADTAGRYPYHETVTADFVYIRLHGSRKLYASDYSEEELQSWARKIKGWGMDTYLYFDNDFEGYAVKNARRIREIMDVS